MRRAASPSPPWGSQGNRCQRAHGSRPRGLPRTTPPRGASASGIASATGMAAHLPPPPRRRRLLRYRCQPSRRPRRRHRAPAATTAAAAATTRGAAVAAATETATMTDRRPLLIVDAPSLLYCAFFALPTTITDGSGQPVNALLGALNMIMRVVADHKPRA